MALNHDHMIIDNARWIISSHAKLLVALVPSPTQKVNIFSKL